MYKVLIRPLKIEDAQTSYKWRNDPEIWKYTGSRPDKTITPEIETEWLQKAIEDKTTARFAILVDDQYIGNIQLTNIDNNSAQYHIFIGEKQYWGKGIAKLATAQIIRFAQNELKLSNVYLKVNPSHIGAIKLYEKCGFKKIDDEITMTIDINDNPLPLVSVFMITYNHEKYIAQAIESILEQKTLFDYDIVIGEDSSTDSTREIILNFYHLYPGKFKLLLHTPNIGAMENMLQTLEACKGKYIAMLEGDDYWTKNYKIQNQVDFLEYNLEYTGITHDTDVINNKNQIIRKFATPKNEIVTINDLLETRVFHTASLLYRAEVTRSYKLPNNITSADRALFLLIASMGKIKFLNESMCCYRKSDLGISSWVSVELMEKDLNIVPWISKLNPQFPKNKYYQFIHYTILNYPKSISRNKLINHSWGFIIHSFHCFPKNLKTTIQFLLYEFPQLWKKTKI